MFLTTNSLKVSLREYLYEGGVLVKPLIFLIAVFVKLFRIPLPGSTDIPAVRQLAPFETTEDKIPVDIAATLAGPDAQLQAAGFQLTDILAINDTLHNTQYGSLVYLSPNGDTIAWLRDRRWPQLPRSVRFPRVALFTRGQNGSVVMTTSAHRDLLDPPAWDVEYKTRSTIKDLIDAHHLHVSKVLRVQRPDIIHSQDDTLRELDELHAQFIEFQTGRGVFVEPDPNEIARPESVQPQAAPATADSRRDAEMAPDPQGLAETSETDEPIAAQLDPLAPVIEEVRRLETKRTQWLVKAIVLFVSVAVFVGLGAAQWDMQLVLMLVPILFVHELGHYIAMMFYGYKNVQMFYIPLLGAAVTGRHYQVAGWKKAMVSLAGPLPSIVLGLMLGAAGVFYQSELTINACLLTLILNVFNLLPFLPLDGGWVAHVTLFCRSNVLDLMFRVGTILALLGGSILMGDRILMYFAIAMAIGLPVVWKTMQAKKIAEQKTLPEPTDDKIPDEAIRQIVAAVQEAKIPAQGAKQLAQTAVSVYESVTTKPPSWPATIGIWTLHGGGVMLAVVGGIALAAASYLRQEFAAEAEFRRQDVSIDFSDGQFRVGSDPLPAPDLLMWDYPDSESASGAFAHLTDQSDHTVARLGTLVFTSRPAEPIVADSDDEELTEDGYTYGIERRCRNDVRLSEAPPAALGRLMGPGALGYPAVLVSFDDPAQAESIVEAMKYLPTQMGDRYPITPWTPRKQITDEQQELRQLLFVLQGRGDGPWNSDDQAAETPDLESLSPRDMKQWIEASRTRHEQRQQRRREWIAREQKNASGARQKLLQTYSDFETAQEQWQQQLRASSKEDEVPDDPPELTSYLEPILPDLGYLDTEDPMTRFAAMGNAFQMSEGDFDEPPLLAGNFVRIEVYAVQDPTAALGGIMAWLKRKEAMGMAWSYEHAVLPEDTAEDNP